MEIDREDLPEVFDVCYVDCDLISYRSAFSAEKTFYHLYDDEENYIDRFSNAKLATEHLEELSEFLMVDTSNYRRESEKVIGDLDQAKKSCDLIIKDIIKNCPAKTYKFYLTGNDTYRGEIATIHKYKGNREKTVKPKWHKQVRQHLIDEYDAKAIDKFEADDFLSVGLWSSYRKGLSAVAANLDKDVLQAPGTHYDWVKGTFQQVTPEEGLRWLFIQTLAGDMSVDNYEGIPGVGKAKARKILEGCNTEREMYGASVEAYKSYFGEEYTYKSWDDKEMTKTAEDVMLENLRLAYMLRRKDEEYKIPKKE